LRPANNAMLSQESSYYLQQAIGTSSSLEDDNLLQESIEDTSVQKLDEKRSSMMISKPKSTAQNTKTAVRTHQAHDGDNHVESKRLLSLIRILPSTSKAEQVCVFPLFPREAYVGDIDDNEQKKQKDNVSWLFDTSTSVDEVLLSPTGHESLANIADENSGVVLVSPTAIGKNISSYVTIETARRVSQVARSGTEDWLREYRNIDAVMWNSNDESLKGLAQELSMCAKEQRHGVALSLGKNDIQLIKVLVQELYHNLNLQSDQICTLSILEIGNEKSLMDRLNRDEERLRVHYPDQHGGVVVHLTQKRLENDAHVEAMLDQGLSGEKPQGHVVVTLCIWPSIAAQESNSLSECTYLQVVQLTPAASVSGIRSKAFIRTSMSSLGSVLRNILSASATFSYRHSTLTKVLQRSLATSKKVMMIGNVSPDSASYEETLYILDYMHRLYRKRPGETANSPFDNAPAYNKEKLTGIMPEDLASHPAFLNSVVSDPRQRIAKSREKPTYMTPRRPWQASPIAKAVEDSSYLPTNYLDLDPLDFQCSYFKNDGSDDEIDGEKTKDSEKPFRIGDMEEGEESLRRLDGPTLTTSKLDLDPFDLQSRSLNTDIKDNAINFEKTTESEKSDVEIDCIKDQNYQQRSHDNSSLKTGSLDLDPFDFHFSYLKSDSKVNESDAEIFIKPNVSLTTISAAEESAETLEESSLTATRDLASPDVVHFGSTSLEYSSRSELEVDDDGHLTDSDPNSKDAIFFEQIRAIEDEIKQLEIGHRETIERFKLTEDNLCDNNGKNDMLERLRDGEWNEYLNDIIPFEDDNSVGLEELKKNLQVYDLPNLARVERSEQHTSIITEVPSQKLPDPERPLKLSSVQHKLQQDVENIAISLLTRRVNSTDFANMGREGLLVSTEISQESPDPMEVNDELPGEDIVTEDCDVTIQNQNTSTETNILAEKYLPTKSLTELKADLIVKTEQSTRTEDVSRNNDESFRGLVEKSTRSSREELCTEIQGIPKDQPQERKEDIKRETKNIISHVIAADFKDDLLQRTVAVPHVLPQTLRLDSQLSLLTNETEEVEIPLITTPLHDQFSSPQIATEVVSKGTASKYQLSNIACRVGNQTIVENHLSKSPKQISRPRKKNGIIENKQQALTRTPVIHYSEYPDENTRANQVSFTDNEKDEITVIKKELEEVVQQNATLKNVAEQAVSLRENLQEEVARLTAKLKQTELESESRLAEYKSVTAVKQKLQSEMKEIQNRAVELESDLFDAEAVVLEQERKLTTSKEEKEILKQQRDMDREEINEIRIEAAKIADFQTRLNCREEEISQLKESYQIFSEKALEKERFLVAQVEESECKMNSAVLEAQNLTMELRSCTGQLEDKTLELRLRDDTEKQTITELETERDALKELVKIDRSELEELRRKLENRIQIDNIEIDNVRKECRKLNEKVAYIQTSASKTTDQKDCIIQKLNIALHQSRIELASMSARVEEINEQNKRIRKACVDNENLLTDDLSSANKEIALLRSELSASIVRKEDTTNELLEIKRSLLARDEQIENLKERLARLSSEQPPIESENKKRRTNENFVSEVTHELEILKGKNQNVEQNNISLGGGLRKIERNHDTLLKEKVDRTQKLEIQIERLHKEHQRVQLPLQGGQDCVEQEICCDNNRELLEKTGKVKALEIELDKLLEERKRLPVQQYALVERADKVSILESRIRLLQRERDGLEYRHAELIEIAEKAQTLEREAKVCKQESEVSIGKADMLSFEVNKSRSNRQLHTTFEKNSTEEVHDLEAEVERLSREREIDHIRRNESRENSNTLQALDIKIERLLLSDEQRNSDEVSQLLSTMSKRATVLLEQRDRMIHKLKHKLMQVSEEKEVEIQALRARLHDLELSIISEQDSPWKQTATF